MKTCFNLKLVFISLLVFSDYSYSSALLSDGLYALNQLGDEQDLVKAGFFFKNCVNKDFTQQQNHSILLLSTVCYICAAASLIANDTAKVKIMPIPAAEDKLTLLEKSIWYMAYDMSDYSADQLTTSSIDYLSSIFIETSQGIGMNNIAVYNATYSNMINTDNVSGQTALGYLATGSTKTSLADKLSNYLNVIVKINAAISALKSEVLPKIYAISSLIQARDIVLQMSQLFVDRSKLLTAISSHGLNSSILTSENLMLASDCFKDSIDLENDSGDIKLALIFASICCGVAAAAKAIDANHIVLNQTSNLTDLISAVNDFIVNQTNAKATTIITKSNEYLKSIFQTDFPIDSNLAYVKENNSVEINLLQDNGQTVVGYLNSFIASNSSSIAKKTKLDFIKVKLLSEINSQGLNKIAKLYLLKIYNSIKVIKSSFFTSIAIKTFDFDDIDN